MSSVHGKWLWYDLMTPEPSAAKAFYEAVLGWQVALGTEPPVFYAHISRADGTHIGGMVALSPEMAAHGAKPTWLGYIGVDDIEASITAITAKGGRLLVPKITISEGSFALVTDPDGAPFYLITPTPPPGAAPSTAFSMAHDGSCSWNELCASDDAAMVSFYGDIFGWQQAGDMDMGPAGRYRFIASEGEPIGAIMPRGEQIPLAHWNHYFRVGHIDAATAAITAHGGKVLAPPHEVPGGDWSVHATDPQGAAFCLVGKRV